MDRVFFMMRVKDGQQDEYIRRHREVWPEVLAEHRLAGVSKMAIFMKDRDLFLYLESEDYPSAIRKLRDGPNVLRWEQYMAPIMDSSDGASFDPTNSYPPSLSEVFYWEAEEIQAGTRNGRPTADRNAPAPHIDVNRQSASRP